MALLFINKVKTNQAAFQAKVIAMAKALNTDPDQHMFVMNFETGGTFSPSITNSIGATGLIQFMPDTAIWLGTTTAALRAMSNVEQLDWVYKFYTKVLNGQSLKSVADFYLATFYPLALSKPETFIIGSEKSLAYARLIVTSNPGLKDYNSDGYLTKAEYRRFITDWVKKQLPEAIANKLLGLAKENIGGVILTAAALGAITFGSIKLIKKHNSKLAA